METDTKEFKELQKKWEELGKVHGIIYKKSFRSIMQRYQEKEIMHHGRGR